MSTPWLMRVNIWEYEVNSYLFFAQREKGLYQETGTVLSG